MRTTFFQPLAKFRVSSSSPTCLNPSVLTSPYLPRPCFYSTQIDKKAAGAFTSNKHITKDNNESNVINKTLVYIGPFSETIRRYKTTASLFGICGICAVPALLSTGEAPVISVALAGASAVAPSIFIHWYTKDNVASLIAYEGIKTIERLRKQRLPASVKVDKDIWLGIEKWTFFGSKKEHNMWLSQLSDISNPKAMRWQCGKQQFTLERDIMNADPFLKRLTSSLPQKNKLV